MRCPSALLVVPQCLAADQGLVLCTSQLEPSLDSARADSSLLASGFLTARTGVYERTRVPWRLELARTGVHEPTRLQTRASWRVLGGFLAARAQGCHEPAREQHYQGFKPGWAMARQWRKGGGVRREKKAGGKVEMREDNKSVWWLLAMSKHF